MMDKYVLNEAREPVPCSDLAEWGAIFDDADKRRVARTELGEVEVSTVFLGIDHRFGGEGPPILFETMVFGGDTDGDQGRCSTWPEAEAMHAEFVARIMRALSGPNGEQ